jgi:methyl coenzyme M reductase alpha subunit
MSQREGRGWPNRVRYAPNHAHVYDTHQVFKLENCRWGVQESKLIFTAIDKVKENAKDAGHLPVIVSENVAGRRYRRWDDRQVSTSFAAAIAAAILSCNANLPD